MPLSISVVITSCAPVRALRKPGTNPYAPPAMVPPSSATTRTRNGGRYPATSNAAIAAPTPPMRNCPSAPRLISPAWNDSARPRPTKMNGVALTSVSEMGRMAASMSSALPLWIAATIRTGSPIAPENIAP